MDDATLLKMAGFSTTGVTVVFLIYRVLKSMVGKKLVSSCCGSKMEIGISVGEMSPTHNPIHVITAK